MFKSISWSQYWAFVLIATAVYYIVICWLYYKNEIRNLLSGNTNLLSKFQNKHHALFANKSNNVSKGLMNIVSNSDAELSYQEHDRLLQEFQNDAEQTLAKAAQSNFIKREIVYSLQRIAVKYPSIKNSSLQIIVNRYIINECAKYCSIHLDEDDLNQVWTV